MDIKDKKPNLGITKIEEPGSFIYVDKTKNKYITVFSPDSEPTKLYAASLFIDFTIDYIEEMTIPEQYSHYASLKITKIIMDNFNSEVYVGSINFKDDPQTFYKFQICERDFKLQEKVNNYRLKDTVQGIRNTAYKTQGDITHFIGVRTATNEEVYVRYNNASDTIESEIAYFSELGDITLSSICLTKENTVLVCGHVTLHSEDGATIQRKPYINIVLS